MASRHKTRYALCYVWWHHTDACDPAPPVPCTDRPPPMGYASRISYSAGKSFYHSFPVTAYPPPYTQMAPPRFMRGSATDPGGKNMKNLTAGFSPYHNTIPLSKNPIIIYHLLKTAARMPAEPHRAVGGYADKSILSRRRWSQSPCTRYTV